MAFLRMRKHCKRVGVKPSTVTVEGDRPRPVEIDNRKLVSARAAREYLLRVKVDMWEDGDAYRGPKVQGVTPNSKPRVKRNPFLNPKTYD